MLRHKKLFLLIFLLTPVFIFAQVAPSTLGGGMRLSAGGEYSVFKPDYGDTNIQGITVFADVDHIFLRNLGVEGEARWLHFHKFAGETQDNYFIGPRYRVIRFHDLSLYGKFLFGGAWITYPNQFGSGSYFAYAPGGTGEFRLNSRWSVRGDFEYQRWPSAPGTAFTFPNPSHGLTPYGVSVGASYRIF